MGCWLGPTQGGVFAAPCRRWDGGAFFSHLQIHYIHGFSGWLAVNAVKTLDLHDSFHPIVDGRSGYGAEIRFFGWFLLNNK